MRVDVREAASVFGLDEIIDGSEELARAAVERDERNRGCGGRAAARAEAWGSTGHERQRATGVGAGARPVPRGRAPDRPGARVAWPPGLEISLALACAPWSETGVDGKAGQEGGSHPVEAGLGAMARLAYRRPGRALAVALFACLLAGYSARRLAVNLDLASLLPPSFRSVQDVEKLKQRFGGVGYVVVVAEGAPLPKLKAFAEDIAPRLAALPAVRYVDYKRPLEFFKARGLYYLSEDALEEVEERIQDRVQYEKRKLNPLFVDLTDDGPPSLDFSDIDTGYLRKFLGGNATDGPPDPYHVDKDGRLLVMLLKPSELASDLAFAKRFVEEVEGVLGAVTPSDYHPGLKLSLTGRYKKKIDQQRIIVGDMGLSSLVALFLVLGYLWLHFRRIRSVVLVLGPLLVGILWTFGLAAELIGQLNILSSFVGVLLLGLGIDHGIHLMSRFAAHRGDAEAAIAATFGNTGRGVAVAALTTTVGFLGLSLSEFRAFYEFGLLAAMGMALVAGAYLLCLPAGIRWLWPAGASDSAEDAGDADYRLPEWLRARRGLVLAAGGALLLASAVALPKLRFDYDFASLDSQEIPSFRLDRRVNEILGRSQTPLIIMTEDKAHEPTVAQALRAPWQPPGATETTTVSSVDLVVAVSDLVPAAQVEKQAVLRRIHEELRQVEPGDVALPDRARLKDALEMTQAAPFVAEDLPEEMTRVFEVRDGSFDGGLILGFAGVSLSDGRAVLRLAEELQGRLRDVQDRLQVSIASEAMILSDVLRMVFQEAPRVLVFTLVLVFIALWALLHSFRRALYCFGTGVLTLLVSLGVAALLGLKLNYLNIVVIPVLFGLSVDSSVHLSVRNFFARARFAEALGETGAAVLGAAVTTAIGFAVLELADHPGLNSFGRLALIGIGANLFIALVFLPALFARR